MDHHDNQPAADAPPAREINTIPEEVPKEKFNPTAVINYFKEMDEAAARQKAEEEARAAAAAAASEMVEDEEEDDGLNQYGLPRQPPKTPPEPEEEPVYQPPATFPEDDGYDEVSDSESLGRPRIGPKTPPEDPPEDQQEVNLIQPTDPLESDGELSGDDQEVAVNTKRARRSASSKDTPRKERRPRTPRTPPRSRQSSRPQSPIKSRNYSTSPSRRHAAREVHSRKRRNNDDKRKPTTIASTEDTKELSFPAVATQKCLSLLEYVEKRGLTISDDELLQVVRDSIVLDQAMERIVKKKEIMKQKMDEMAEWELDNIRKIHSNLPRHMQDVLKFDGKTVHISEERTAMPSMPPFSSSLMSLKYGHSFAHHMGMPPPGIGAPPFAQPPVGMPPPSLGMPPPPLGLAPPPFAVPPPMSLLGAPPPFSVPPLVPPPTGSSVPIPPPRVRSGSQPPTGPGASDGDGRGLPPGLNPIAFSNVPQGIKMNPLEYSRPPPNKKPAQNPQMTRITNNLSSMLTNALKAQVSKTQNPFNTESGGAPPAKKAVPSLMSINIPGVPKAGPPGSQK